MNIHSELPSIQIASTRRDKLNNEVSSLKEKKEEYNKTAILFMVLALIIGKVLIILIFVYYQEIIKILHDYQNKITSYIIISYILYLLASIISSLLFVPVSIVMMTGGFIFSVNFEGKLYGYFIAVGIILITTIISGYITFVFSQRFLKNFLRENIIVKYQKLRTLDNLLFRYGWKIIFLIRLSPIMPLFILNYLLGGFSITHRDYLLGGFGSISITLLYVYFGYLTVNIQEILNLNFEEKYNMIYLFLNLLGIIIIVGIFCIISRYSEEELNKFVEEERKEGVIA